MCHVICINQEGREESDGSEWGYEKEPVITDFPQMLELVDLVKHKKINHEEFGGGEYVGSEAQLNMSKLHVAVGYIASENKLSASDRAFIASLPNEWSKERNVYFGNRKADAAEI